MTRPSSMTCSRFTNAGRHAPVLGHCAPLLNCGYSQNHVHHVEQGSGKESTLQTPCGMASLIIHRPQHARRRRVLADRYANSNVVRQPSLAGIAERASNFVKLCTDSRGGSLDLYVSSVLRP